MNLTRRDIDKEQGFTLIELLVVILIIGILAAIAIPMFLNQRKSAADAALESDMKNMATAMETWQSKPQNLAQNAAVPTPSSGWGVIERYDDKAIFSGDWSRYSSIGSPLPEAAFPGFPEVKVSEGVAIGIVAAPSITGGSGYCIVGNANAGNYSLLNGIPAGKSAFATSMYYDSRAGGLVKPENVSADGACGHYKSRINSGY